jgi:hypothetical protein
MTTNFFHPSLLLLFLDPGSGIRDPGSEIRDPGSEIRDPGSRIRNTAVQQYGLRPMERNFRAVNERNILNYSMTKIKSYRKRSTLFTSHFYIAKLRIWDLLSDLKFSK